MAGAAGSSENSLARSSGSPLADVLVDRILFPLLRIPAVMDLAADFIFKRGSQLDVNYRASSLSEHTGGARKGINAGDRAPDGHLLDPSGRPTSVFAQFRTPDFRLLIFAGRRDSARTGSSGVRRRSARCPACRSTM